MAEEEKGGAEGGAAPAAPKAKPPLGVLLILVNTLLVLAALGMMVYTKLLFKRPVISEETELEKKIDEVKAPAEKSLVSFDQILVNIAMTSGKTHYATLQFTVECRTQAVASLVEAKKAHLIDKVIASLSKRQITELNTIQGKLLLKTELLREFNALTEPGGVTDMFFPTFILQ